jgi:hypothetical protein
MSDDTASTKIRNASFSLASICPRCMNRQGILTVAPQSTGALYSMMQGSLFCVFGEGQSRPPVGHSLQIQARHGNAAVVGHRSIMTIRLRGKVEGELTKGSAAVGWAALQIDSTRAYKSKLS